MRSGQLVLITSAHISVCTQSLLPDGLLTKFPVGCTSLGVHWGAGADYCKCVGKNANGIIPKNML